MSVNIILSPIAKVRINATTFAVTSASLNYKADVNESTDSENTGYKEYRTGGLVDVEMTFQGYLDTTVSHFTAPLSIQPGASVAVLFYPKGLSYTAYTFSSVIVRNFNVDTRVQGSQPATFSFTGVSSGAFTVPSD